MTGATDSTLVTHLLRRDGQEDLCFAAWRPSTGRHRRTAIIEQAILPSRGDRHVHGNASFEAAYVLRAAQQAAASGRGLAFLHSHPRGRGWQGMSGSDRTAESRIANLARELTGLPIICLTLAGDRAWSGRIWGGAGRDVAPHWCESVRVIGDVFSLTFNDTLLPIPTVGPSQVRTFHTWGKETQATIARLRVAVVGVGSVGMTIADVLARTGIQTIGVFDFDTVETGNLDRLRGASQRDARLMRAKSHVARRLLAEASTAARPTHEIHELSICEREGLDHLLDFDIIFSCVDRPWPRHVLNTVGYADLIPVIDGGLRAFQNPNGSLRNAYWRAILVRPGRPCLACLGQYDPAHVQLERDGSLDDPSYIADLPPSSPLRGRENVSALSASVAAAELEQFVSYVARPSGFGDPGPLRFSLRDHTLEKEATACDESCPYQESTGCGDARADPTSRHVVAEEARRERAAASLPTRACQWVDNLIGTVHFRLGRRVGA